MAGEVVHRVSDLIPRLDTPRLVLRAWRPEDARAYHRIVADPEVMRYMGSGPGWTAKRAAAAVVARVSEVEARRSVRSLARHWERHGYGEWALEERASGRLIGRVGLRHQSDWHVDPSQVEIGWLLSRRAWGRGYATEAARAGVDHAFGRLGLARLVSIALVGNRRSQRVMEKLGLTRAGRTHWKGSDVVWYGIDRDAWE